MENFVFRHKYENSVKDFLLKIMEGQTHAILSRILPQICSSGISAIESPMVIIEYKVSVTWREAMSLYR